MTDMTVLLKRLDALDDLPDAVALRERGYDLLRPADGQVIVDVGCGSGRAVSELARRGVRAHGVDPSEVMIDAARQRWSELDFHLAPAERLPFGDGEVDGFRADKVLHALEDPGAAIAEALRVLKPGGRAVLVGQDWDHFVVDADDHDLTRRIVRTRAAGMPSPNIARGYGNLLRDNGFTDVTMEMYSFRPPAEAFLGTIAETAEDIPGGKDWLAEQHRRAAEGRTFIAVPIFLAAGTRP
ncbi:methyltransferase domain-containing protein [Stackebrandtia nassauensis]|uniref:Methyltransferase type 11 n=1 Tax=Stackebrandtia nassauensis (strain DSM 44728 / CIP 108903 / NRRL B-16338 / NBRC 102104 / LLR-40K-21) TaxID=446470 RepID=D3PYZ3_STANL|nr:methyltransferase domain-containing protein [Stackebrandtia nassauensis]ADD45422.1 Methyltransferase type 11 [Stackebrandtia nassauensis DSM 44728]